MGGYLPPGCTQDECDQAQPGYWDDPEDGEDEEMEAYDACGRWDQSAPGGLSPYCRLAGTEHCDFECPLRR